MRKLREALANFSSQLSKIILFASSYIPLLIIIILQLIQVVISENNDFIYNNIDTWSQLFKKEYYVAFIWIIILFLIIILLWLLMKRMLGQTIDSNLEVELDIINVQNINSQNITNYFSVYIFPFITLNLITFSGMGTLIILLLVIGYVYIKNDLLYINPILNIFFKYSIYTIEVKDGKGTTEVILLSQKNRTQLKRLSEVSVQKIGDNVYIEFNK